MEKLQIWLVEENFIKISEIKSEKTEEKNGPEKESKENSFLGKVDPIENKVVS